MLTSDVLMVGDVGRTELATSLEERTTDLFNSRQRMFYQN
ncbi:hypothetical protein HNQ41_000048 [Texcoconibacillus texcoconensis]|uniref:Uncharacterized protein n=1 Tax=Texcoconibacillus texcoconensis TaxID=1095777 RepID=A0A840QIV6_9BACI|nr:hypothetical protein [Texcoconibacillus texcoconensis]